jgi:hypothetical protein
MFLKFFVAGAFFLFFFNSCQTALTGFPEAAEKAAISDQKAGYENYEFKNFKITCEKRLEITPAESANGVTEKWCARLEYIFKKPGEEKWQDGDNTWTGLSYQGKNQGKILLKTKEIWSVPGTFCKCADGR